jgi:hypothetical protein
LRSVVAAALAVALLSLAGCKRSHTGQGEVETAPVDAGPAVRDGGEGGVSAPTPDASPADDAMPAPSSEELTVRARHLLESIAKDNADLGTDILFPRDGWLATRDAADPGKEWDKLVSSRFRHTVHKMAKGREDLDRAQQVTLEIGHAVVQTTPRRHAWKKALWQVHGSRLTYVVDGHTRTITIREMTAWRGSWYVTKLR